MLGNAVALIPLRSPGAGKSRLAPALDRDERAGLAGAMLADVVGALRRAGLERLVVAAGGAEAAAAASALGVDVLHDPPGASSLNGALRTATARLAREPQLLVVTADLPRLTAADVEELLDADAHVVVAATKDGGTGGLLRRPPNAIDTAYGPRSAAQHLRLARSADLTAEMVRLPGFQHDVDTWEDLAALLDEPVGPTTAAFLARTGLAERLAG